MWQGVWKKWTFRRQRERVWWESIPSCIMGSAASIYGTWPMLESHFRLCFLNFDSSFYSYLPHVIPTSLRSQVFFNDLFHTWCLPKEQKFSHDLLIPVGMERHVKFCSAKKKHFWGFTAKQCFSILLNSWCSWGLVLKCNKTMGKERRMTSCFSVIVIVKLEWKTAEYG